MTLGCDFWLELGIGMGLGNNIDTISVETPLVAGTVLKGEVLIVNKILRLGSNLLNPFQFGFEVNYAFPVGSCINPLNANYYLLLNYALFKALLCLIKNTH